MLHSQKTLVVLDLLKKTNMKIILISSPLKTEVPSSFHLCCVMKYHFQNLLV